MHCQAPGNPCRGIGDCKCECGRCLAADRDASRPEEMEDDAIELFSDAEYTGL